MLALCARADTTTNPPVEWIDPDTGHRVIQLSREPGSESLYFNLNPFTPDGRKMVITTPDGIAMIDLQTRKVENIVAGRAHVIMVGRKTGQIYYGTTNRTVFAVDPVTKVTRKIVTLPRGEQVATVNADETLLAGTVTERTDWGTNRDFFDGGPNRRNDIQTADAYRGRKGQMMEERLAKRYPMELFFYNITTGKTKKFNRCNDWLGHLQFSPTDPNLLMFCHEGPWHKVDRIWTIRSDGVGFETDSPAEDDDGNRRPRILECRRQDHLVRPANAPGRGFLGRRLRNFQRRTNVVSFATRRMVGAFQCVTRQRAFLGDGGDDKMVAHADNGKWLYLFRPELISDKSEGNIDTKNLIQTGVFRSERLVNMSKHDYALEPNAMFSPDMKWLIFRSNTSGANQVYAVELKKADEK